MFPIIYVAISIYIPYNYYIMYIILIIHVAHKMFARRSNVQDISPTLKVHTTRINVVSTCLINVLILTLSSGLAWDGLANLYNKHPRKCVNKLRTVHIWLIDSN